MLLKGKAVRKLKGCKKKGERVCRSKNAFTLNATSNPEPGPSSLPSRGNELPISPRTKRSCISSAWVEQAFLPVSSWGHSLERLCHPWKGCPTPKDLLRGTGILACFFVGTQPGKAAPPQKTYLVEQAFLPVSSWGHSLERLPHPKRLT